MTFLKKISAVLTAAVLGLTGSAWCYDANSPAAQIVVNYTDAANYGFNDLTLGNQRKTALEYALNLWAAKLKGSQTIRVDAFCQNMGGTPTGAVLASAGPLSAVAFGGNVGRLFGNTYYPTLLANQYGHQDYDTGQSDIEVTVNIDVDNATVLGNINYYYGTNASPGPHIDFVAVMLHELGHGLGFVSFMDPSGALFGNLPDGYSRNLVRIPGGSLMSMTNAQRQSAMVSNQLFWDGSSLKTRFNTNTSAPYGNVKMYAPLTYEGGSSVSHFDTSNTPNMLMEPAYTGAAAHSVDVTGNVLYDIGWYLNATALPVSLSHFTTE